MSRSLSYSEITAALTCEARHAFRFTGRLTDGVTLRPRRIAANLSNGRAWGAGVAAWHADGSTPPTLLSPAPSQTHARLGAHEALLAALSDDVREQAENGVWIAPDQEAIRGAWLAEILDHYMATATRLTNLTQLEGKIDTPIPSRTGKRGSSLYRFGGYIDGFSVDELAGEWTVEFKFRKKLTPFRHIQLSPQVKWYAWARQRVSGSPVVGAIVDERLAEAPKPPRIVRAKRKSEGIDGLVPSHAVDQLTTAPWYIAVCEEFGVEPHPDTVAALEARVWQQRHPIIFRAGELEEAGHELVSAAQLIRDLDLGNRYPIRNARPQLCNHCEFFEACPNPSDRIFLETLYSFSEPKRLRVPEPAPPAAPIETNPFLIAAREVA